MRRGNMLLASTMYTLLSFTSLGLRMYKKTPRDLAQDIMLAVSAAVQSRSLPAGLLDLCITFRDRAILHLKRSFFSTLVVANAVTAISLLRASMVQSFFLGSLTATESMRLAERVLKLFNGKIVFLAAVGPLNFEQLSLWFVWVMLLSHYRAFLGLLRDRVDTLTAMPQPSRRAFSLAQALLLYLTAELAAFWWFARAAVPWVGKAWAPGRLNRGWYWSYGQQSVRSWELLWTFDVLVVFLDFTHTAFSTVSLLLVRLLAWARSLALDHPWSPWHRDPSQGPPLYELFGSSNLAYHVDALFETSIVALTLAHYMHLWWMHGVSFHVVDMLLFMDVRMLAGQLSGRFKGLAQYWGTLWALRNRFPEATAAQLLGKECVICQEEMQSGKVLPCGHVFHSSCLCAWLQQQGRAAQHAEVGPPTCPLCRQSVLLSKLATVPQSTAADQLAQASQAAQQRVDDARGDIAAQNRQWWNSTGELVMQNMEMAVEVSGLGFALLRTILTQPCLLLRSSVWRTLYRYSTTVLAYLRHLGLVMLSIIIELLAWAGRRGAAMAVAQQQRQHQQHDGAGLGRGDVDAGNGNMRGGVDEWAVSTAGSGEVHAGRAEVGEGRRRWVAAVALELRRLWQRCTSGLQQLQLLVRQGAGFMELDFVMAVMAGGFSEGRRRSARSWRPIPNNVFEPVAEDAVDTGVPRGTIAGWRREAEASEGVAGRQGGADVEGPAASEYSFHSAVSWICRIGGITSGSRRVGGADSAEVSSRQHGPVSEPCGQRREGECLAEHEVREDASAVSADDISKRLYAWRRRHVGGQLWQHAPAGPSQECRAGPSYSEGMVFRRGPSYGAGSWQHAGPSFSAGPLPSGGPSEGPYHVGGPLQSGGMQRRGMRAASQSMYWSFAANGLAWNTADEGDEVMSRMQG